MKHKHYDCIVAWAEGKKIQVKNKKTDEWEDLCCTPSWNNDFKYRIKPEPKPDLVKYVSVKIASGEICRWNIAAPAYANLILTFDSGTGELKSAEVI